MEGLSTRITAGGIPVLRVGKLTIPYDYGTIMQRFLEYVEPVGSGCWIWKGTKKDNGYGVMYPIFQWRRDGHRGQVYAHRLSFVLFKGPIPDGLEIDHGCRKTMCVCPWTLEAVTRQVNLLRGETVAAMNAVKTHCPSGHVYDTDNTYVRSGAGGRVCRACGRIRRRNRVAANKE